MRVSYVPLRMPVLVLVLVLVLGLVPVPVPGPGPGPALKSLLMMKTSLNLTAFYSGGHRSIGISRTGRPPRGRNRFLDRSPGLLSRRVSLN